jgi:hypothetical protein
MEDFIRDNTPVDGIPEIDMENARRNYDEIKSNTCVLINYNSEKRLLYHMYKDTNDIVYIITTRSNVNSYSDSIIEYCLFIVDGK